MRKTGQNLSAGWTKNVQTNLFVWLVLFLAAGLLLGCGDSEKDTLRGELNAKNRRIDSLTARNDELELKAGRLQEAIVGLQAELENHTVKEAQLRVWARQLADSFGPGVWFISGDERPLPYKKIKDATLEMLIRELNLLFTEKNLPTVTLSKSENDTVFLQVSDENMLTQEMGTTGATAYIEAVTYTLTSLKNIHYVQFDFKEGDHAIPGRYSR